jgi:hypothetical protein
MGGHGSLRERLGRVFSIGRVTLVSFGQYSQVVGLDLRIRVAGQPFADLMAAKEGIIN